MDRLIATFRSGDVLRSRSVSAVVQSTVLELPVPAPRLLADWHREACLHLGLEPGDIEAMSLARTRLRWAELRRCFEAVGQWLGGLGLSGVPGAADVALMASRGTAYHHDGANYGGMAFCNVFLCEDGGADLHFPVAGPRVARARGTAVLFDPCQPHAIVKRGAAAFDEADFAIERMGPQIFLSWELPIEHEALARRLGIAFDATAGTPAQQQQEQVWRNGKPVELCPRTGGWLGSR